MYDCNILSLPFPGVNYTIIRLPFWYENFTTVFRPHKVKHGVYAIRKSLNYNLKRRTNREYNFVPVNVTFFISRVTIGISKNRQKVILFKHGR